MPITMKASVIFDLDQNSTQTGALMEEYGNHLFYLPFYGMNIGFFLTLSLSLLTGHGRWWWKRSLFVAVKSLVGGVCGYLSFFIGCVISISLNFKDNSFLIDWIPWMLSGFMIAFIVAYGTDIKNGFFLRFQSYLVWDPCICGRLHSVCKSIRVSSCC